MADSYKYKTFQVKVAKEGQKPILGNIQKELAEKIKKHGAKGWRLVSITPINSGAHDMTMKHDTDHDTYTHGWNDGGVGWGWGTGWGAGAGWGYGYTSHLLITMEKQG